MQQISTKRVYGKAWLGGESDPLGIVQEIEIWPYEQVVYASTRIRPREWDTQTSLEFWDSNGSPNLGQTIRPRDSQYKKTKRNKEGTCRVANFTVPANHRVKLKESEKKNKYLDLARELKKNTKKLWRWQWYQL